MRFGKGADCAAVAMLVNEALGDLRLETRKLETTITQD